MGKGAENGPVCMAGGSQSAPTRAPLSFVEMGEICRCYEACARGFGGSLRLLVSTQSKKYSRITTQSRGVHLLLLPSHPHHSRSSSLKPNPPCPVRRGSRTQSDTALASFIRSRTGAGGRSASAGRWRTRPTRSRRLRCYPATAAPQGKAGSQRRMQWKFKPKAVEMQSKGSVFASP